MKILRTMGLGSVCCLGLFFCAGTSPAQISYQPMLTSDALRASKPDRGLPVGSTAGSFTIQSGKANYAISISCPPGTGGMQPQITLQYNHQTTRGIAGAGWSIGGLSAIVRVGNNNYHDGQAAPVSFEKEKDNYVLDGMRLIPVNGKSGQDGTIYGKEQEDYTVIKSIGSEGNGPASFVLTLKNGTRYLYGETAEARIYNIGSATVMSWLLSRVMDANGNEMNYHYQDHKGEALIQSISYTGNRGMGLAPYNQIAFQYQQRNDGDVAFEAGNALPSTTLLEKIIVTGYGGGHFRTYALGYAEDNIQSYLQQVQEYGTDHKPINPTRFAYTKEEKGVEVIRTNIHVPFVSGNQTTGHDLYAADLDGDGSQELLTLKFRQGAYPGTPKVHELASIHKLEQGVFRHQMDIPIPAHTVVEHTPILPAIRAADFNGDGRDDLMAYSMGVLNGRNKLGDILMETDPMGNSNIIQFSPETYVNCWDGVLACGSYAYTGNEGNYIFTGDFDGDGRADILTILNNACNRHCGIWAFLTFPAKGIYNHRVKFDGSSSTDAGYFIQSAGRVFVVDTDGDGRHELMAIKGDKTKIFQFDHVPGSNDQGIGYYGRYEFRATMIYEEGYPTQWHEVKLGDFNGDGKTDLLTYSNTGPGNFNIAYSTGKGFREEKFELKSDYFFKCLRSSTNDGFSVQLDDIYIGDLNGDGRDDILHIQPGCGSFAENGRSKVHIYYAGGYNRFHYETYEIPIRISNYDVRPIIADINGDGKGEFIFYPIGGDGHLRAIDFRPKQRLLELVRDGMGHTSGISYAPLHVPGIYQRDRTGTYPINTAQAPVRIVAGTALPDGIGGTNTTSYAYRNLFLHRAGRGMLGFEQITATDNHGRRTTETYLLDTTYYILSPASISEQQDGLHISERQYQYLAKPLGGKRFFQALEREEFHDRLKGNTTSHTYRYDPWGNVDMEETDNGFERRTTNTALQTHPISGIPSLPQRITVTSRRHGAAGETGRSWYQYDRLGNMASYRNEKLGLLTTMQYDGFGNRITETTTGGPLSAVTSTKYEQSGRSIIEQANPLGQKSYFSNDPVSGMLGGMQGIDGLRWDYSYDGFGSLIRERQVERNITATITRNWADEDRYLYFEERIRPGKPTERIWYDQLGRMGCKRVSTFGGAFTYSYQSYDNRGNLLAQTASHKITEEPMVTSFSYDRLNRPVREESPMGTKSYRYHYSGGNATTTTEFNGQRTSITTDASGRVIGSEDGSGILSFQYDSWGRQTEVWQSGKMLIKKEYDARGYPRAVRDINMGTINYTSDSFGRLTLQQDAAGSQVMAYDLLGNLTSVMANEGNWMYEYTGAGKGLANQLSKAVSAKGDMERYHYDHLGRMTGKTLHMVDGTTREYAYGYDSYDNQTHIQYPTGVAIQLDYDGNGILTDVRNSFTNSVYYSLRAMNGLGQPERFVQVDGKVSEKTYRYGFPLSTKAEGIFHLDNSYDSNWNLVRRLDRLQNFSEIFSYDQMSRLAGSQAMKAGQMMPSISFSYDGFGNITNKTDLGNYRYNTGNQIHRQVYIEDPLARISREPQHLTFTSFGQPDSIVQGKISMDFHYGPGMKKIRISIHRDNVPIEVRNYMDGCDLVELVGVGKAGVTYIPGGDGIAAIVVNEGGREQEFAVYRDHLGSINLLHDRAGNRIGQRFTAWGERLSDGPLPYWLIRGYGGHEQLDSVSLIHMGARLYDPIIGRMVSPDNMVGDPQFPIGYNRYAYARNNPLKYVDPDGNNPVLAFAAYAVVYGAANLAIQASQDKVHDIGSGLKAFGMGALQGAVSYLAAGCPVDVGWKLFANAGLTVASSWVPPMNIPIGNSASLSLSPSFGFGSGAFGQIGAGFGIGARASLSMTSGDSVYSFSTGISGFDDAAGQPQSEGLFSAGVTTTRGDASSSFYLSSYTGAARQYGMTIGMRVGDYSMRYANDAPFSDQYRSFGLELGYRNYTLGTHVLTSRSGDVAGDHWQSAIWGANAKGTYRSGSVIASPAYIGYRDGNLMYRIGVNHPLTQDFFQNGVHKALGVPYWQSGNYSSPYGMIGTFNPYSLF